MRFEPGDCADFITGATVGGKSHQVIQNDHVHGVGDLSPEAFPMRRFPGCRRDGVEAAASAKASTFSNPPKPSNGFITIAACRRGNFSLLY
jgi:hypothetical protein